MSVAFNRRMTLVQFLEWEALQPTRFEFDGFQPVAMVGGTRAHADIQRNLTLAIGNRLMGSPCTFYGSDLKVQTANDRVRYPAGFVVCSQGPGTATMLSDPVVIFEVLSPSTAANDFQEKNVEYAAIPSVVRYVMLSQDKIAGTMFERRDGDWIGHLLTEHSTIRMPEIGIEVPIEEFYRGVELPAKDEPRGA